MTTRRTVLLAATGALATSVVGCGDGAAATAEEATWDTLTAGAAPVPAPPAPEPPPAPAPALSPSDSPPPPASSPSDSLPPPSPSRAPPSVSGGSVRQLGTQTLVSFLTSVRSALPEGLTAANQRMLPIEGILAFCGATIWRNKYSLGAAGAMGTASTTAITLRI